jgi:hypothetical protein
LLFSPSRGLVARWWQVRQNRTTIASQMLVVHLLNHERGPDHESESSIEHLREGLRWTVDRTATAVDGAMRRGWINRANGHFDLTDQGRQAALAVLAR